MKNDIKQIKYSDLPYIAKGSLTITLDLPMNKISINDLNNKLNNKNPSSKQDERPIFAILRTLSQIVGTTLRIKQDHKDGSYSLKPTLGDNGENMTEIEVVADNRMCEYDCFDSATQIANYLAAFQARTNELSHQFGQASKFSLKSIRASEYDPDFNEQQPKNYNQPSSFTTWVTTSSIIIFVGLMLGVLIKNREKRIARGITWFPEGMKYNNGDQASRSVSASNAAGANYMRKPLSKALKGFLYF